MKFEFDGREFDTDKPIYVLGYSILKSWFSLRKGDNEVRVDTECYLISCKKLYVHRLNFCRNAGTRKNEVSDLLLTHKGLTIHCDKVRRVSILGHSVAECQKILEEWRKEREDSSR